MYRSFYLILLNMALLSAGAQTLFRQNGKWGARSDSSALIPAVYDTIIGPERSAGICVACVALRYQGGSGGLSVTGNYFKCHYINRSGKRLVIKDSNDDTCSVFAFPRNAVAQFMSAANVMVVGCRGEKHLVGKDFRQITYKGYHNIYPSPMGSPIVCERLGSGGTVFAGVVGRREKILVPFNYSSIQINNSDSLIVACSAGLGGGHDDVYDFSGQKLHSSSRHIQQISKRFMVQKIFEPRERYFLMPRSGDSRALEAEEILLGSNEQIIFRKNSRWFAYDAESGEKQPINKEKHEKDQSSH